MAELHEDDLFRKSSMSFGEHLEELRSRLFRAALWLLGGVIIGFIVGQNVVAWIEAPMQRALNEFWDAKTRAELTKGGNSLSEGDHWLIDNGYISDEIYVRPEVVFQQLKTQFPELAKLKIASPAAAAKPAADAPALLPITIWRPSVNDPRAQLKSFNPMESFMIYLKAALLAGAILASPFIFHEMWMFVAAGLYPHERRYVHIFLPVSVGLFILGVVMAFFVALPTVLHFLLAFNTYMNIDPQQRIEEYLSFALFLPLAFGVGFQLPLVMLFVNRIGFVSVETFIKQWRIAVLAIFVIAMILTPSPDVYTMSLLAVPMSLLYFGGIALCKYTSGRRPVGLGGE